MHCACFINGRNEIASDSLEQRFNSIRGEDEWIGRRVKKEFGKHGIFFGRVTNVDDDSANDGHRIFECTYDDGDVEWIGADEVADILLPEQESVCMYFA